MNKIRVKGIGENRKPIARTLMAYFDDVPAGSAVSGVSIRGMFVREGIDTWEGAKVLGTLRNGGVLGVVDEKAGAGPVTWRRRYAKLADWDDRDPDQMTAVDTTMCQRRAYESAGRWTRLPEGVDARGLRTLREAGFEIATFIRTSGSDEG